MNDYNNKNKKLKLGKDMYILDKKKWILLRAKLIK